MSLKPPSRFDGEPSAFIPAPAGTHLALCYGVVDLGIQSREVINQETGLKEQKPGPKILLLFELPNCQLESGAPQMCSKDFWVYRMVPKGKTRKDGGPIKKSTYQTTLEGWIGEEAVFSPDFSAADLVGKPAQITIVHKTSLKGNTYASVTNIVAPMQGLAIPPLWNNPIVFDLDSYTKETWDRLSPWTQQTIKASPSYAPAPVGMAISDEEPQGAPSPDEPSPF